ncbi:GNAT family N-acetyltransferase [Mycobacterium paraterrae]|uniref:GNAT family N-acetyltransferase n=1 Tax=Mycobacterium paraterrae TaxID=577492 RepID=A0ABY3VYR0_9MYCO|nr:GNAT family N-acetyltransferase [Mycobacterium paraterrae]UMB71858.1 GNAT family N-acetyltransferase [Mycobacterium paraterrae]
MAAFDTRVRHASPQDAAACLEIYRPYVENCAVSWELEPPTVEEMANRIATVNQTHAWLVLERDQQTIGFANGHALWSLPSYRWSTQTGLYIHAGDQRRGGGRILYTHLLQRLGERGYRRAFAGITQPNEASNAFHRSMGFQDVGIYRRVEWKNGQWHDVAWMQRDLPGAENAADPPGVIT